MDVIPGFKRHAAAWLTGGPGTAAPAVAAPSAGHRLSSVASARHALEQHGTLGQEDESGSDWSDFGSEASFQSSEQHHGSEQTQEQVQSLPARAMAKRQTPAGLSLVCLRGRVAVICSSRYNV